MAVPGKAQGPHHPLLERRRLAGGGALFRRTDKTRPHRLGRADLRDRRHQDAADLAGVALQDARRKVALIAPAGKTVLDTCGGLGYFAAHCLTAGAARIVSFEKNTDVLWLRTLNPWSPDPEASSSGGGLQLKHADISQSIADIPAASVDAVLHDPPRFGIAGELYSQTFYDHLARVLRPNGHLFHYTGAPNRLTSGRGVPREVARRLEKAGFRTQPVLDGVLAVRRR